MVISLTVIIVVSLGAVLLWLRRARSLGTSVIVTPLFIGGLVGALVLSLPLLCTPAQFMPTAGIRVAGLLAGLAMLLTCLQLRPRHLGAGLYVFVCCAALQTLIAGQQLLMHRDALVPLYGLRPYGTFFQPNVLASFLATGLALAWALLVLPYFGLARPKAECGRQTALLFLMALLAAMLVWIQSRVGWLGGLAVTGLFVWRLGRHFPCHCRYAVLATLAGVLVGMAVLAFGNGAVNTVNHTHSNLARWSMFRDTLSMIVDRPLSGWGYGSFEYAFQHFRINQVPPTLVTEIARHPHNEILLWVAEGGIIALFGLSIMLASLGNVVRRALQSDRQAFAQNQPLAGVPTALCIALVPIFIHTQLEYPFYQSALHGAVFLFLLAMADRLEAPPAAFTLPDRYKRGFSIFMATFMLGVAVLAGFALKGNLALTQTERFGMADMTPVQTLPMLARALHRERAVFDEQVHALLTYNHTRDEQLLTHYRQWAGDYLQRRIDKEVYANLIAILQHQGHPHDAECYRQDAARLFPEDTRFNTQDIHPQQEGEK